MEKTILIVDGYNIIGAWPELIALRDEEDLEAARDRLIDKMAEFKAFTGYRVIVVFDAHYVPGTEKKIKNKKVEVIFTKKDETADERIERLAKDLSAPFTKIYVATSDYTEQRLIFGGGALRQSARELLQLLDQVEREIHEKVES
ncbi:MAG: NYN domain-containing protein, partial [Bacillales bacterium]